MKILILNAGSSSQKSCLYELSDEQLPEHPPQPLWKADIDWTASSDFGILTVNANGVKQEIELRGDQHLEGIAKLLNTLVEGDTKVIESLSEINCVGHRIVHGGKKYSAATLITPEVEAEISNLIPLAPAHNPAHLEGITAIKKVLGVAQVAVFDTAFHTSIPDENSIYPLPYEWSQKGIRRYGFHGTSHQYCANRAAQILGKPIASLKIIACHLGNGCSLTAIKDGKSIDTTMGFTPLEGLMMGTRSGSFDPAILIYLMKEHLYDIDQLNHLLNKESGLKGISGISGDLRPILEAIDEGNERAKLAFKMYIHLIKKGIGEMLSTLEGADLILFTAGVGENAPIVREKVCHGFGFLGWKIDQDKNNSHPVDTDIATPDSTIRIMVIHTEEDWAIAQECWHQLKSD
ncbi:acetate kinase [Chroococcus sp. FPU101]|uniref:acetate kinase n=1 Tax=Chroococcus sp. FPU101 TaxID=1974212 RepID=UPI001A905C51|nr:acetate kinase [Chroococcus sp. FPU101]GFE68648.1 acetate kinase [Chroococcus sp. FPU101]